MKIEFVTPTEDDHKKYEESLSSADCLNDRVKIILTNDDGYTAETFMKREDMDRLGEDYIRSHAKMYYNEVPRGWFVNVSENDYYNDPVRNPEKVIPVEFRGVDVNGREVYKEIPSGRYFLRENFSSREPFAKWYVCGGRLTTDCGDEPRANLVFECGGQREKVRYDDWNGVAAYEDTYNKDFSAAARAAMKKN